jgi:hypothetical protein
MNVFSLRTPWTAARAGCWAAFLLTLWGTVASAADIVALDPQYRDRWKVVRDQWDFQPDGLTGKGNSEIAFQGPFQPPFTVDFHVTVLDGMRPRVHIGPVMWGNEGFKHTFQILPDHGDAALFPYELNKDYHVTLVARPEGVEMIVDGHSVMTAAKKLNAVPEIKFRGGDNWSKGTTRFSRIVIGSSAPPASLATAADSGISDAKLGELVKQNSGNLVLIESKTGSGSGFIAEVDGAKVLFTNLHVLSLAEGAAFTPINRSPIVLGGGAAAVDHDVAKIAVASASKGLTCMKEVDKNATIGDEVVVLGNAEGQHVINPIRGKLIGIGPNLVEVDAPFLPGNSGSPIIHVRTGQVIGIATYAIVRRFSPLLASSDWNKVRRFGYRLDSIQRWQPVQPVEFFAESAQNTRVKQLTEDLVSLWKELAEQRKITPGLHQNPVLQQPIADFLKVMHTPGHSQNLVQAAQKDFLWSLHSLSQGDITTAKSKTLYDYFQRSLAEEGAAREEIYEALEKAVKM